MRPALVDDDTDDSAYFYDWDNVPPKKQTFWTDERVERLTTLYKEGRNTNAIAALLRTTKGAVIGKANRLFLVHGSDSESVLRLV